MDEDVARGVFGDLFENKRQVDEPCLFQMMVSLLVRVHAGNFLEEERGRRENSNDM